MSRFGTIKKVRLDLNDFKPPADVNATQNPDRQIEEIAHAGGNSTKETLQAETVESVTLIVSDAQLVILNELLTRTKPFPMSYQLASGSIYRADGWINHEGRETEEGRLDVKLIPETNWEPFIA